MVKSVELSAVLQIKIYEDYKRRDGAQRKELLKYIRGDFMPATVKCPYCHTVFTTAVPRQTTCRNRDCKAIIHVDANGYIRKSQPAKRK